MIVGGRWVIGAGEEARPGDRLLCLDVEQARAAGPAAAVTYFHEVAIAAPSEPAAEVVVEVPGFRGNHFAEMLEWLVCTSLAEPSTSVVTWRAMARRGAEGVERMLARRGWSVTRSKAGGRVELRGTCPAPGPRPEPRGFVLEGPAARLAVEADWGVFSPSEPDPGSRLLVDVAIAAGVPATVTDVGVGYGAIPLLLATHGHRPAIVATEVDAIAAYFACRNARVAGLELETTMVADPATVRTTGVTLCNVPTHLSRQATASLVDGLVARSRREPVLCVVHGSLERRYRALFARGGARSRTAAHDVHAVLELASPRAQSPARA